jgi:hypothetical protein
MTQLIFENQAASVRLKAYQHRQTLRSSHESSASQCCSSISGETYLLSKRGETAQKFRS